MDGFAPRRLGTLLPLATLSLLPARLLADLDCGCTDVGPYSDPEQPAKIVSSPSGLVPLGKCSPSAVSLGRSIQIPQGVRRRCANSSG